MKYRHVPAYNRKEDGYSALPVALFTFEKPGGAEDDDSDITVFLVSPVGGARFSFTAVAGDCLLPLVVAGDCLLPLVVAPAIFFSWRCLRFSCLLLALLSAVLGAYRTSSVSFFL